jgi:hypothetical protein
MSGPLAPDPQAKMQVVATATVQDRSVLAEEFLFSQLGGAGRSIGLGDLVRRGASSEHKFSAEETRGAVASLVDEGQVELTDDLHLRLRRSRRR